MDKKTGRPKLYPVRIVVPLTQAQHDLLRDRWLAGGAAVVEQVRRLIDASKVSRSIRG